MYLILLQVSSKGSNALLNIFYSVYFLQMKMELIIYLMKSSIFVSVTSLRY